MMGCKSTYGDDESSEPILVTNGVKQGCELAPTLFSIMFSAMLTDIFRDDSDSIDIRYCTDRKLLNLRRLKARFKVKEHCVRTMLFANGCALNDGMNWKCNASWVNSHLPVMLMVSPSVQGKWKSCASQHLTTT